MRSEAAIDGSARSTVAFFKVKIYKTGLFSSDLSEDIKIPWFKPRGWEVEFVEDRFVGRVGRIENKTSKVTTQFAKWHREVELKRRAAIGVAPMIRLTENGAHAGSEILIKAESQTIAQNALNLVSLGRLLHEPEHLCTGHDMDRRVYPADASESLPEDRFLPTFHTIADGVTIAALIAARLSQKRRWQTAAWRFYYSCRQHYSCWKDTHPGYSDYKPVSDDPKDFIPYANAIHSAYAVLEDLGLEVRANGGKPSTIKGVKNPIVWDDLRSRLVAARVNPDWEVVWKGRASVTRITKARRPEGVPAEWAGRWLGSNVLDKMVATLDAIFQLSFLRSKAGAHGSLPFSSSLTVYDVENAQRLAWCVLMQAIGCG